MRISLGLPTQRVDRQGEFVTGAAIAEMARAAEAAGFDAVYVTEHPMPEKRWMDTGGHHALDPFVALAFAAAATTTLRLQTHLCVLPYRNPFVTAKAVASLDVLSGGRVIFGVGTGYLEAEFAALGVDFAERNELTDEAIVAMKAAWSGEPVDLAGRHFSASGNLALPRPVQSPCPPIWVGGNSTRAIRRAVELADGWAPMPNAAATAARRHSPALESLQDLERRIGYACDHAASVGRRTPLTVASSLGGLRMDTTATGTEEMLVEVAGQLAGVGVTYLYGGVLRPVDTRAEFVDEVVRMGETLVPRIAAIDAAGRVGAGVDGGARSGGGTGEAP
ncbi:MAG TPA: TIGR03619 family F420-dependent LLM class oxidoreductase [Acidimicrobiales bacterium]|nr:TIGR03619 family F420-dependent LLM class oxidoreductase [Acidimicrobiales bacterium]